MEKSMLKKLVDWDWKKILIFFLIFMGIFAVFTVIMNVTRVVNPELYDILDLEFAWTSDRVEWILASWSMQGVLVQELAHALDRIGPRTVEVVTCTFVFD